MTRAERREANRARHAAMRAELEAQWREAEREKREEKRRQREANRAAWWARYGMGAPGADPDDAAPIEAGAMAGADPFADLREAEREGLRVPCCDTDEVGPGAWHVRSKKTSEGYEVREAGYTVTMRDGCSYPMPTLDDCAEFIRMAEDTIMSMAACHEFQVGQVLETDAVRYEIVKVNAATVGVHVISRDGAVDELRNIAIKHDRERGQFFKPNGRSWKWGRAVYAADMAA